MITINNIKNSIGAYLLQKQIHPTPREYTSLANAKEIGIIYNGIDLETEAIIHKYAHDLKQEGKKVFLMGYIDLKTLPGNKNFSLQSEYCWKEKLNFFNLPDKSKFSRFLDLEFDLLLNLYTEPLLPMQALSAYAKAKYRVGPKMEHGTRFVDAQIDTGANKDIHFLIEQMDFYLRHINA